MAVTTNYSWTKPVVNGDTNTWGTELNTDLDGIDSTVFAVSSVANAAMPKAGGTFTGAVLAAVGSVAAPSITFTGDTDNGLYYVGVNHWALAAGGAQALDVNGTAITVPGTLTVTGASTLTGAVTCAAELTTAPSAAGSAGLNLPHGAAPTTPVNGDVWTTTAGAFVRVNGATLQFAAPAGAAVSSFNTRVGAITLSSADVTTALGFTPENAASVGTAATQNTGTSGANVPLLNGSNTTSGNNTHSGTETFNGLATVNAGLDLATPMATPTTTEAGYMGAPQNAQAGNYTAVLSDRAKEIFETATSTVTIPANASVAYPIGTTMLISADVGAVVTVAINSDTLRWVPSNTVGSRTLTGPGTAVVRKEKTTEWWIRGDVT